MRYTGLDLVLASGSKLLVIRAMRAIWPIALVFVLVLLAACSSTPKTATPSSTAVATSPNGPTLGPAAVPSQDNSTNVPSATTASTVSTASTPSAPQQQISAVATDILNIRSGPGLNYAVKGQLKQGDAITITGKSADGLWWQFSGGWVSATYVKVTGDATAVPVRTPSP